MDIGEARAVLGVSASTSWTAVRTAYRTRIRAAHPDTRGDAATAAAARLNEAYAVLRRARDRAVGTTAGGAERVAPRPPPPAPPAVGIRLEADGTLLLAAPPDQAFALLVEAGHRVGDVSYLDRACAIFEVVVRQDGETCSLLVTLQGRGHGTVAELTLEALERAASLPPDRVVRRMVDALA